MVGAGRALHDALMALQHGDDTNDSADRGWIRLQSSSSMAHAAEAVATAATAASGGAQLDLRSTVDPDFATQAFIHRATNETNMLLDIFLMGPVVDM